MIKKNVLMDFNKIKVLDKLPDLLHTASLLHDELDPIYMFVNEQKNKLPPQIIHSLANYMVVRTITIAEQYFRALIRTQLDANPSNIHELFDNDSLSIPLVNLERIREENITVGKIVASNFNFQNITEIDFVMSKILKIKFLDTMRNNLTLPNSYEQNDQTFKRMTLLNRWNDFISLFSLRNKIVHTTIDNVSEIEPIYELVMAMQSFLVLSVVMVNIKDQLMNIKSQHKYEIEFNKEFSNEINMLY